MINNKLLEQLKDSRHSGSARVTSTSRACTCDMLQVRYTSMCRSRGVRPLKYVSDADVTLSPCHSHLRLFPSQVVKDAGAGVVLRQREEALQEVRQRQSAEDSLQEAPG